VLRARLRLNQHGGSREYGFSMTTIFFNDPEEKSKLEIKWGIQNLVSHFKD
jgi:hypothetical protein